MPQRGDELLTRVCAGENDSTANDLLDEFHAGFPVERLSRLLRCDEEHAVKAGAWIASELGANVAPVMDDLSLLLDHPVRYVRFFVLDAVLAGATPEHGEVISRAMRLLRDRDEAVRWKALHFLTKTTSDQLSAAIPHLRDDRLARLTAWMLNPETDTVGVIERLQDTDGLTRLFAGAAAARLRDRDPAALKRAAASSDRELGSFAEEELEANRSLRRET